MLDLRSQLFQNLDGSVCQMVQTLHISELRRFRAQTAKIFVIIRFKHQTVQTLEDDPQKVQTLYAIDDRRLRNQNLQGLDLRRHRPQIKAGLNFRNGDLSRLRPQTVYRPQTIIDLSLLNLRGLRSYTLYTVDIGYLKVLDLTRCRPHILVCLDVRPHILVCIDPRPNGLALTSF